MRSAVEWILLVAVVTVPVVLAMQSPLLQWRAPVYIGAGLAGILAMGLMLVQPVMAAGWLSQPNPMVARRIHRVIGGVLVAAVVAHVAGLWITSPPDVIDVLLFRSPAPFSIWGAVAMWVLFAAAALAVVRRPLRIAPRIWRHGHAALTAAAILCTVLHVVLIEGTMEPVSKWLLSGVLIAAVGKAFVDLRLFRRSRARG